MPASRKTVCIVGAGPAGLTAARSLLHYAPAGERAFDVTILDAQPRIGGLWPTSRADANKLLHPLMVANQSRHTVQFSDLAWDDDTPQFPRAWQVGRYLEQYRRRYCAGAALRLGTRVERAELLEGGAVVDGGKPKNGADGAGEAGGVGWKVWTKAVGETREKNGSDSTGKVDDGAGGLEAHIFNYLLVASGFFGVPIVPEGVRAAAADLDGIPVIHSSKYRSLQSLLSKTDGKGGKILVVGNQLSGVEIAGTIATHLSSAVNLPGPSPITNADKYSIHHIVQRPTWIFPMYTSPKASLAAAPFLPLDLPSYNLSLRPQPLANTQGLISVEAAKMFHGIYQGIIGTDQSDVSPLLAVRGKDLEKPPFLAISDWYLDFVRSGLITVSRGKLKSLHGHVANIGPLSPSFSSRDNDNNSSVDPAEDCGTCHQVDKVAAVVLATGFTGSPSLSFLPTHVREALSFAPDDIVTPVALAFHGTHHPAVPHLGFVGFYRSPYWGVMEMQARILAVLWAHQDTTVPLPPHMIAALRNDTSVARTLALRAAPTRTAQFPMGDYIWLMQELAGALGLARAPHPGAIPQLQPGEPPMDIVTPARWIWLPPGCDAESRAAIEAEVGRSLRQLGEAACEGVASGRFMARAVFRALLGEWRLERDLASCGPAHPSGHFSGTARFLLRNATRDGLTPGPAATATAGDAEKTGAGETSGSADGETSGNADGEAGLQELEYLYIEEGIFTADVPGGGRTGVGGGMSFRAERRYVWRYDEGADKLSVWFVKTDDRLRADYLFHEINFLIPEAREGGGEGGHGAAGDGPTVGTGLKAEAGHMCVEDFYDVRYKFGFQGVGMKDWTLCYTVKGPNKDYTITGVYKR